MIKYFLISLIFLSVTTKADIVIPSAKDALVKTNENAVTNDYQEYAQVKKNISLAIKVAIHSGDCETEIAISTSSLSDKYRLKLFSYLRNKGYKITAFINDPNKSIVVNWCDK